LTVKLKVFASTQPISEHDTNSQKRKPVRASSKLKFKGINMLIAEERPHAISKHIPHAVSWCTWISLQNVQQKQTINTTGPFSLR